MNIVGVDGHWVLTTPTPRQPKPVYWYSVGCNIGCKCSGDGKEMYPTPKSLNCTV